MKSISHLSLTALLALGFSSGVMAQSTTTVYQDNFDDGDITTNPGIGGAMTFYDRSGGPMTESAAGLVPSRTANNQRGNATSAQAFSLVGGFQMTVEFTVATGTTSAPGNAWRGQFGLSASENVVLSEQTNSSYAQSFLIGNNSGLYRGLGLVTSSSDATILPGLYNTSGAGLAAEPVADRLVDSAQAITLDEPLVVTLTVLPDQSYSYSINEETASEGTLAIPFDFSKTYHFHFYDQDTEFITSLQSVTLEVFNTPDLGIPVITTEDTLVETGDTITFDVTFDPTATTAVLDVPGAVDLDLLALDTDGDGIVQITETASASHLYEILLTKTGVDDANTSIEIVVLDPSLQAPDNAFSTAVRADSPLFYYRFEEAAGSPALFDSSSNSNHADNFVNATLGSTPIPGGMGTSSAWSSNGYIFVPTTSNLTESFTFMTMLNLDNFTTVNNRRDILSMAQGTGTAGIGLLSYNANGFVTTIGGGSNVLAGPTSFSSGDSCLLHFVYDADPDDDIATAGGEARLYLNGVLAGSVTGTTGANTANWILASNQNLGNLSPSGWMDESAIFASDLTEAQITAHSDAFFTAADPLLGFRSEVSEINSGDLVTLVWKVSDAATLVTINGTTVTGAAAGGVYSMDFSPTVDTTYTIEATSPSGTLTSSASVIVNPPIVQPGPPVITSFDLDSNMVTINFTGSPSTLYNLFSTLDLEAGFDPNQTPLSFVSTDAAGIGAFIVPAGTATKIFYRVGE